MIKFQERIGLEVTHLSITKFIDDKSITNILPNGDLQAFLLKTGLLLSPLFFRIVTETLTSTIRQKQEIEAKKRKTNQIIPVCRIQYIIQDRSQIFYQKTSRNDQSFSRFKLQNPRTQISSFSIHQCKHCEHEIVNILLFTTASKKMKCILCSHKLNQ